MTETIGKKLCQARLAKGLTIDEAAHETRLRPDKIVALENDDYSRFGSNAYAKGFLQIYGRLLGVDVSQDARALETSTHLSVSDYQYLNHIVQPEQLRSRPRREARPPSVVPLLVFMGVMAFGAFIFWFNLSMKRLGLDSPATTATLLQQDAATPIPVSNPTPAPAGHFPGNTTPVEATPGGLIPGADPEQVVTQDSEVLRAVPLNEAGAEGDEATALISNPAENEIVVEPLRKTYVRIWKDDPNSQPFFEDFLYPSAQPLKLKGSRFFVEVRDESAVQIRRNGHPIAYQSPGIAIQ